MLHKNANIWIRLFYRIFDLLTFVGIVFITYHFMIQKPFNESQKINSLNYYLFLFFSFIYSFILFILIPFLFENRTVWMIISKVQVISNQNTNASKRRLFLSILFKRSIFSFWLWFLILLAYLIFINANNINEFIDYVKKMSQKNKTNIDAKISFQIVYYFVSGLIGTMGIFYIIDIAVIILSKKKLSLIDIATDSRIVWLKHYKNSLNDEIKLIPFKIENKKINMFN